MTKVVGEKVVQARAQKAFERGGTVLACTRYGNVMCSRGSVIPLFIDQIKRHAPITITDPNMTRFLMNLDEAADLVAFAFEHAEPGDLFVQKADASTIGDLADGVMKVFGETEKVIIGSRHGEKLYETLVTREEMLRSVDIYVYRFENMVGKWIRPRYNSAVGTFCYCIARNEPITVNDPSVLMEMVYLNLKGIHFKTNENNEQIQRLAGFARCYYAHQSLRKRSLVYTFSSTSSKMLS